MMQALLILICLILMDFNSGDDNEDSMCAG
jgi:hypothetical protein